jgi:hypothetical protein
MIFPSCKDVSHLVSQGLDRQLGFGERLRLRLHLAICEGCRNFERQMDFLRKAMQRLASRER